eukprot:5543556-Alexandrium_andersonii.AAC.1
MSASLVGSEMCIRDSASGVRNLNCVVLRTTPNSTPEGLVRGFGVIPVSYTHLTLPTICSV